MKKDDTIKEGLRALLTSEYNTKNNLLFSEKAALDVMKNTDDELKRIKERRAGAILSQVYVHLLKENGWQVWDVSDYAPDGQGQFIGTYKEYLRKAKQLGIPKENQWNEKGECAGSSPATS